MIVVAGVIAVVAGRWSAHVGATTTVVAEPGQSAHSELLEITRVRDEVGRQLTTEGGRSVQAVEGARLRAFVVNVRDVSGGSAEVRYPCQAALEVDGLRLDGTVLDGADGTLLGCSAGVLSGSGEALFVFEVPSAHAQSPALLELRGQGFVYRLR